MPVADHAALIAAATATVAAAACCAYAWRLSSEPEADPSCGSLGYGDTQAGGSQPESDAQRPARGGDVAAPGATLSGKTQTVDANISTSTGSNISDSGSSDSDSSDDGGGPLRGPLQLGSAPRPPSEEVLWKLVDRGIVPRYSQLGTGDKFSVWERLLSEGAATPGGAGAGSARLHGSLALPPSWSAERAHRKQAQIGAIARLVHALIAHDDEHGTIVDFCGGSGHLALVLAVAFPRARVVVVDFNAVALRIARERAASLGLVNFETVCGDVAEFPPANSGLEAFAVGVALHACGTATDLAMQCCRRVGAVSPPPPPSAHTHCHIHLRTKQ